MALSWNEIKDRTFKFAKEWENETSVVAEAKFFWDGFFDVFGISRKRVAYLSNLYQQITSLLPAQSSKPKRKQVA